MTSIRSIVAATDLSVPARHAAERAARVARAGSASLTLAHALSGSALDDLRRWLGTADGAAEQALLADARRRLHELASELELKFGIPVGKHVGAGHVVAEIVRQAEERQADLVVTGTRGADFMRHLLLGLTAERLLKKSSRPVLLVRQAPHEPYRRVLVPVDFSPWSEASVALAGLVAPEAHLVLMHAVQAPFEGKLRLAGVEEDAIRQYRQRAALEAREGLQDLARRAGLAAGRWSPLVPQAGDAGMQIVQQEQEQDCDLIVLGKHGRHALEDLLLGSTTQRVITEAVGDVLVSTQRGACAAT